VDAVDGLAEEVEFGGVFWKYAFGACPETLDHNIVLALGKKHNGSDRRGALAKAAQNPVAIVIGSLSIVVNEAHVDRMISKGFCDFLFGSSVRNNLDLFPLREPRNQKLGDQASRADHKNLDYALHLVTSGNFNTVIEKLFQIHTSVLWLFAK
jgi:hypothetical protein